MDRDFLIRVFVPVLREGGADGGGLHGCTGTAYPVGKSLFLTARHVVRIAERDFRYPIEIQWVFAPDEWHRLDDEQKGTVHDKRDPVVWEGKNGLDAALVRCVYPPAVKRYGLLARDPHQDGATWSSAGFAEVAKANGVRNWASFSGTLFPGVANLPNFEIDVTSATPNQDNDWSGASGMPVSLTGSDVIHGVVVCVPSGYAAAQKLYAASCQHMWADPEFQTALGVDSKQDASRENYRSWLTKALGRSPILVKALAATDAAKIGIQRRPECNPKSLADWLLNLSLSEALTVFWEATGTLEEEQVDDRTDDRAVALSVLQDAVRSIAPALYDQGIVGAIRTQTLDANITICQIPTTLPTVAEIIMAAVDDRRADYHPRRDPREFPHGRRFLPKPPEAGIDSEIEQARTIRDSLTRKFAPTAWTKLRGHIDDYMIKALVAPDRRHADEVNPENLTRAADALDTLSRGGRSRFYLLCRLPAEPQARAEVERDLQGLKATFKSLVILGLTDDPAQETREMKAFDAFRLMLPEGT